MESDRSLPQYPPGIFIVPGHWSGVTVRDILGNWQIEIRQQNYYRKNLSPTHGTKSVDKEDAIEVSLLRNAFGCLWNKEGVFFVRKRLIRTFTF